MQIIQPKILKGTREFGTDDMSKRNCVMDTIKRIFSTYGYGPIETPILNPAETILGKYGGEGDRLTYNFKDNGNRSLALPYDLTVPFARYFAANWQQLPLPFKRYQIQRVWRAEKPQKGRLREFYQCDIDIIGTNSLLAEAEVARVITNVFTELGFSNFKIKTNSRRLMNDIFESFNVPKDKAMQSIRIIDKLGKIGEEGVLEELKKLGVEDVKNLLQTLKPEGSIEATLSRLSEYDTSEIETLVSYCKALQIPSEILNFDPTLARGLDYYTGIIYEVISLENPDLGSLCGGGRYDNLCGLFCKESFSGMGVAFGFERIMIAMEERGAFEDIQPNAEVLVTVFDEDSISSSLEIYELLTSEGISAEIYFEVDKLKKQLKFADKKGIPFVIIQGPEEKEKGEVMIKSMKSGKQKSIPLTQLINYLKSYEQS
ncbi:histidine--tRNA ligase [Candidatus Peregrinibacteria bacterium]|jgi:histidyl-tRNA synthetase|nr:histidine--tRNA ligase [Candidatus Peregrinibacteria bacterium]